MKLFASIHVYNRPRVLKACLDSVFANTVQPTRILIQDNGSDEETQNVVAAIQRNYVTKIRHPENRGATFIGANTLRAVREFDPEYFFFIEGDYIFKPWAFEQVLDIFEHTEEGKHTLGIVGYDHPITYVPAVRDTVFPRAMAAQVGEDNTNRAALYIPRPSRRCFIELASNTCPTCYLHWRKIREIAEEFPELDDLLDQVMDPRENPNYPDSGKYKRTRQIDDGMLSHAISLCWNRWAIKHGIDRNEFGAWLNIKPSIAQNITGGGFNSKVGEMQTDGGSPTWTE